MQNDLFTLAMIHVNRRDARAVPKYFDCLIPESSPDQVIVQVRTSPDQPTNRERQVRNLTQISPVFLQSSYMCSD